ncbi:MAG: aminopeptidase [Acidobacteria bacterium]|nr:aminopeptidase [Acidobacteriota bacterium]
MGRFARGFIWTAAGAGAVLLLAVLLPGCAVGYVARQSATHLRVLAARQPVDQAIADGKVPPDWLHGIETIRAAKQFGVEHLDLPAADLYETISLVRPDPTWVVTACPRDALQPVTWWFPVAGRVAYRGYYDREDAQRFAAGLRRKDLDVMVRPAGAFSTLGWFADPIRPSMLQGRESQLVDLVLHEAAHRLVYIKGQTDFNEALATFVGRRGTLLFYRQREDATCPTCRQLENRAVDATTFATFLEEIIQELTTLYDSPTSREEKLTARRQIFADARRRARRLPSRGAGYEWFAAGELDNAVILSLRRYGGDQDIFADLLSRCGDDLRRALRALHERFAWKGLSRSERRTTSPADYLRRLLSQGSDCLGEEPETLPAQSPSAAAGG